MRVWLSGFVVNRWREVARAGARDAGPPIENLSLSIEDVALRGVFDRIDLERVIAALPPGYRQIFVLHDIEGYTHQEIAGLLDIAAGTSKSQLSCARRELRRALALPGEQHA